MQVLRDMETGSKLAKVYEENEKTLERMIADAKSLSADGYELESRFRNIKRKSPCPCNSGKKFKNCCGE